ncbi:MAG: ribonuclease III [Defluviitaleaceae bacterium]|nr:ribonuclease III [Defluviitaleaceae bacterium]
MEEIKLNDLIDRAELVLGYKFKDTKLLLSALTHKSYVNESTHHGNPSIDTDNERLEFLGDAVLETAVSEYIYNTYPTLTEGQMTKLRATVICEASLSAVARQLNLGKMMRIGRGEEATGGSNKPSILADCYESIIGASFLDGGFDAAKNFILLTLEKVIKENIHNFEKKDYKTNLQEFVQSIGRDAVIYEVIGEDGPQHMKVYTVAVSYQGRRLATASGKSKKDAEQAAAKLAIEGFK